jgi:glycosyltransferase involved in cell wall biosynthesis
MRILFLTHHRLDRNAGAAGATLDLGDAYAALGHRVSYFSLDDLPSYLSDRFQGALFPEFAAAHVRRQLDREPVDVIDASCGDAWLWATTLGRGAHRPVLATRNHGLEHLAHRELLREVGRGGPRPSRRYRVYRGGYRLWEVATALRHSDLALFVNSQDREYAVTRLGVRPERSRMLPNGLPDYLLGRPFPEPGAREGAIGIAHMASWLPMKGIRYVAPALAGILRRHPHVRVTLLGTGRPANEVLSAFETQLRPRVRVLSHYERRKLPSLLAGHQIALLASLSEGFGISLLEAMACGLAPLTSASAGALEFVSAEDNGLVVPVADCEAIERALDRLISDRGLLDRLRHNAHASAQPYGWTGVAEQTLDAYREAAGERGLALEPS